MHLYNPKTKEKGKFIFNKKHNKIQNNVIYTPKNKKETETQKEMCKIIKKDT